MPKGVRVKPGKSQSLLGMIIGIVFVFIGLFTVIPIFGAFGIIWTVIACCIACVQGYNFFSNKGIATWEIDVDANDKATTNNQPTTQQIDFETKLRKLTSLRDDGIISEEEYQMKKEEILNEEL
jgi:membrane-bound ClpP family serine protease